MMTIEQVRAICLEVAEKHGFDISGVPISVNKRFTRTLGRVTTSDLEGILKIEFSGHHLADDTDEAIRDTVLHELAHAFVFLESGSGHGHDATFKAMCARLGTIEDMAHAKKELARNHYKYNLYCAKCGKWLGGRSRRCPVVVTPEDFFSKCCTAGLRVE